MEDGVWKCVKTMPRPAVQVQKRPGYQKYEKSLSRGRWLSAQVEKNSHFQVELHSPLDFTNVAGSGSAFELSLAKNKLSDHTHHTNS